MTGPRTIATVIVAWLLLCAVGFSVASCVEKDDRPPMPGPAPSPPEAPLTIAWTYRACVEVLSDDARVKFYAACGPNHVATGTDFVACSLPGNSGPYAGPHLWTVEPKHVARNLRSDTVVFR